MSERRRFYTNSFLLAIDAFIAAALTGVFWLIASRTSDPALVGITSTTISAASLIALGSRLGFDFAIPHFLPKTEQPAQLIRTAFLLTALSATVLSTGFLLSLNWWLPDLHFLIETGWWMAGFVALSVSLVWINVFLSTGIASRQIGWVVAQDVVQNGGRLVVWALFFYLGTAGISGLLTPSIIGALGSVLLGFLTIFPREKTKWFDRTLYKQVGPYAWLSYGSSLIASSPGFLLPLIITALLGPTQTAIFSMAWLIFTFAQIGTSSFLSIIFAEGNRKLDVLKQLFPLVLYRAWGIIAVIVVLVIGLGKLGLSVFGELYAAEGYGVLVILTASLLFQTSNDFCMIIHRVLAELKAVYLILACLVAGVLGLSILGIPKYGIEAVGWSYLATHATVMIGTLLWSRRTPLRLRLEDVQVSRTEGLAG